MSAEIKTTRNPSVDLESRIMDCWSVVDDIKVVNEAVQEKDLTPDQVANALLGLETLYQLKFERLFSEFERLVKTGAFSAK